MVRSLSRDRKRSTDWMFMLGLSETIDRLAMTNSVHWYGCVLRREDGLVLLDFEAEEDKGRKGG